MKCIPTVDDSWSIQDIISQRCPQTWEAIFESVKDDLVHINEKLMGKTYFPPKKWWFRALELTPLPSVKVVILGQDPYPRGEAVGLSFSISRKTPIPSSLKNIFNELTDNFPDFKANSGDLIPWASREFCYEYLFTVEPGNPGDERFPRIVEASSYQNS